LLSLWEARGFAIIVQCLNFFSYSASDIAFSLDGSEGAK
jgi:hypothetical protein